MENFFLVIPDGPHMEAFANDGYWRFGPQRDNAQAKGRCTGRITGLAGRASFLGL